MRVLVTGSRGMLGQDVVLAARERGWDAIGMDRDELDITDAHAIETVLDDCVPEAVVNTASYNLVDKIEDPAIFPMAYAVNGTGPGLLARACAQRNIPFVHFSTDYVFDGNKDGGYREDDAPRPISRYAETKRAGEAVVQQAGGRWYVCRTSRLFGRAGSSPEAKMSFPALMLKLAGEKPALDIVDEEYACPTYTPHLAAAALDLLVNAAEAGFYHLVNEGTSVTWYQFAEEIFKAAHMATPRRPVAALAFPPRPAARPKNSTLLNTRAAKLPPRADAIRLFLDTCLPSSPSLL